MKCEVCGAEISSEALEANACLKCGAIIDIDAPFKDAAEYKRKAEFVEGIQNLMNTNLTVNRSQEEKKQETIKKVNDAFEYRAEIIASNPDGTISSEKLNSQLKVYAEKGWRLANSFCNVIGKNQVAGYAGVTGGLAASGAVPITQIILIFERRTGAARRPMAPQGQPGAPGMPPAGAPRPGMAPQGQPGGPGMPPAGEPKAAVPAGAPQGTPAEAPKGAAPAGAPGQQPGGLFGGKKPTPRPMTPEEIAQANKQKSAPGAPVPQPVKKEEPGDGDGTPKIIPIR